MNLAVNAKCLSDVVVSRTKGYFDDSIFTKNQQAPNLSLNQLLIANHCGIIYREQTNLNLTKKMSMGEIKLHHQIL